MFSNKRARAAPPEPVRAAARAGWQSVSRGAALGVGRELSQARGRRDGGNRGGGGGGFDGYAHRAQRRRPVAAAGAVAGEPGSVLELESEARAERGADDHRAGRHLPAAQHDGRRAGGDGNSHRRERRAERRERRLRADAAAEVPELRIEQPVAHHEDLRCSSASWCSSSCSSRRRQRGGAERGFGENRKRCDHRSVFSL